MIELILTGLAGAAAVVAGRMLYKYLKTRRMMQRNKERIMANAGLTGKYKSNHKRATKLQPRIKDRVPLPDGFLTNLSSKADKWPKFKSEPAPITAEEFNRWREQNKYVNPDQEANDEWVASREKREADNRKAIEDLLKYPLEKLTKEQNSFRDGQQPSAKEDKFKELTEVAIKRHMTGEDLELDNKTEKRIVEDLKNRQKQQDELKRQLTNPKPVYHKFLQDIKKNKD